MTDPLIYKTNHAGYTIEIYGRQAFDEVLVTYSISNGTSTRTTSNYKKFKIEQFLDEETALSTLHEYAIKIYSNHLEGLEREQKILNVQQTLNTLSNKWSE